MNSTKEVLAELRTRVDEMRRTYNDIRTRTDRDARRRLHYRLSYLVPLHRALANVVQQQGSDARAGEEQYIKCFEEMRSRGRIARACIRMGQKEMHFGAELADLRLLVPVPGAPASVWAVSRVADIIQGVRDALAAEHQESVRRAMQAKGARAAFLASLTEAQRGLLQFALYTAKASGTHAVSFDHRDFEGAR